MNNEPRPPRLVSRILRWFCKPYYLEIVEGDLNEIYQRQYSAGSGKAKWSFIWNVVRFFRPRYLKSIEDFHPKSSYSMFKNYLKITTRSMKKHGIYTAINISGLAVGLASCLLIMIHVYEEFSYDKFRPNVDNIFYAANRSEGRFTPALLVSTLVEEYPEVVSGTRVRPSKEMVARISDKVVSIQNGLVADSTFFQVFETNFIQGDPDKALVRPRSMAVSERFVEKYLPDTEPLDQRIEIEGEAYTITGIFQDQPTNTHLPYDFVIDFPREDYVTKGYWTGNNFFSYIKLVDPANKVGLENKMADFVRRHFAQEFQQFGQDVEEFILTTLGSGNGKFLTFLPIKSIHLHHPGLSFNKPGKFSNVIILFLIGILIMTIAAINYVNMTTARAGVRQKEVGVRKVLGSTKKELVNQFFTESFVVAFGAVVLGFLLCVLVLPFFNDLTQRNLNYSDLFGPQSLAVIVCLLLGTTLLSGAYPAFYISSIQTVSALKGDKSGSKKFGLRKFLVVFQFAVSIFLIALTVIIDRQVSLMRESDLGFDSEQIFAVENISKMSGSYESFRNELLNHPDITEVTLSNTMPSGFVSNWSYESTGDNSQKYSPDHIIADENFMKVLGLELLSGRYFESTRAVDSASVVINEYFAKALGGNVVGQELSRGWKFRIIGVVKDFHASSVKNEVRPLVIRFNNGGKGIKGSIGVPDYALIRIESNYSKTTELIEEDWERVAGDYPFEGAFVDDRFAMLYDSERRFGNMFTTFSILAVFIASMGLMSLAAYVIEKKYKEIAIRKVLGASSAKITQRILMDFIQLVALASIISIPAVYFYGNEWLTEFAQRISIEWFLLVVPVGLLMLFSLLTVGLQSLKAASANPVNALKQE